MALFHQRNQEDHQRSQGAADKQSGFEDWVAVVVCGAGLRLVALVSLVRLL